MRAVTYRQYGPPEVLAVEDVAKPVPANDEVLIKVRAVEVTKGDCEMRSFDFAIKWVQLPLRLILGILRPKRTILGGYFSGEIEAVGTAVSRFSIGQPVFGAAQLRLGAYAEYMTLPETYTLAPKPDTMSFEDAAAVPMGGLNALHFLRLARIQPGERVLVNGAGGSIGTHAVQIARLMGADVTAVDCARKEPLLRRLGANHFIDYETTDFTAGQQRYDVIFDMVPNSRFRACINALNPRGRYLHGNPRLIVIVGSLLTNWFSRRTATFAYAGERLEELLALKSMIEDGRIVSIVDRILPLEQAAEAHRLVETEQRLGAIVLSTAGQSARQRQTSATTASAIR
jgi:NADPH:quinone reductase-like Zn-dependent oxidoreductase